MALEPALCSLLLRLLALVRSVSKNYIFLKVPPTPGQLAEKARLRQYTKNGIRSPRRQPRDQGWGKASELPWHILRTPLLSDEHVDVCRPPKRSLARNLYWFTSALTVTICSIWLGCDRVRYASQGVLHAEASPRNLLNGTKMAGTRRPRQYSPL